MKIIYLLWSIGLYGGVKIVFEHANRLIDRGHEVKIVTHVGETPDWFPLKAELIKKEPFAADFPKADVVVATYWPTAYEVARMQDVKRFYLVQGKEPAFYPDLERVEIVKNTYRLPLKPITVSDWLGDYLKKEFCSDPVTVPNGINPSVFKLLNSAKLVKERKEINILLVNTGYGYLKGIPVALKALHTVKKRRRFRLNKKKVKITFVSTEKNPPKGSQGIIDEFISNPSQKKLVETYNQGDVFVHSSVFEGFSLPPLEAMACANAVVVTDSGGNRQYCENEKNCLLLPAKNPEKLAEAIERVVEDDDLRIKLANHGLETAKMFDWDNSINKLEKVFKEA